MTEKSGLLRLAGAGKLTIIFHVSFVSLRFFPKLFVYFIQSNSLTIYCPVIDVKTM